MLSINSHERGSVFWILVFVVVVVWGLYAISQRTNLFGAGSIDESNETSLALESAAEIGDNSITKLFTTMNGYDTSRGKVVITNDKFRNSTIVISAVMPSELSGTYYRAKITGTDITSDISLGKLSKSNGFGSYTVGHELTKSISEYSQIIISLDGAAETVEGKTLPHNVMVLDL